MPGQGKEVDHMTSQLELVTSQSLSPPAHHQSQPSTRAEFMVLLWFQPAVTAVSPRIGTTVTWLVALIRSGVKAVFSTHSGYFHSKGQGKPPRKDTEMPEGLIWTRVLPL